MFAFAAYVHKGKGFGKGAGDPVDDLGAAHEGRWFIE